MTRATPEANQPVLAKKRFGWLVEVYCNGEGKGKSRDKINPKEGVVGTGSRSASAKLNTETRLAHTNIDIRMDVRCTAEMPRHVRPFDALNVPDFVVIEIPLLVEGEMQCIQTATSFDDRQDFIHIFLAINRQQRLNRLLNQPLLIAA